MSLDGSHFDSSFVSFYIKPEWHIRFSETGCNSHIVYNFSCTEIVRIKNHNKTCLGSQFGFFRCRSEI